MMIFVWQPASACMKHLPNSSLMVTHFLKKCNTMCQVSPALPVRYSAFSLLDTALAVGIQKHLEIGNLRRYLFSVIRIGNAQS